MALFKRRIRGKGIAFITEFEGWVNGGRPYNDPVGYATVGWGHLYRYAPVLPSDRYKKWLKKQNTPGRLNKREANKLLKHTLNRKYEPPVRELFRKRGPLHGKFTQGRYDALVSFAYNLGPSAVIPGTPGFETMGRALKSGNLRRIGDAFLLYDKAGGGALPGLTRRRKRERRLFLHDAYHAAP